MKLDNLKEKAETFVFGKSRKVMPFDDLSHFDRFVGELQKNLITWRLLALLAFFSTFLSIAVAIWACRQPKTVPVLITMADWGEAKYTGRADNLSYSGFKIPDVAKQFVLREFIRKVWTIPQDFDILKTNLEDVYSNLTSISADTFSRYLKADSTNPVNEFKAGFHKNVEIETILRLSEESWQVDFVVSRLTKSNELLSKTRMRAVCGLKLYEPAKDDIIKNPLGIYITSFDFSEIGDAK